MPLNSHHHIVPQAQISLTFPRHSSLSYIAFGRSSWLHPGRPTPNRSCEGVHRKTSLMKWPLLLQQSPVCLVRLIWIVLEIGDRTAAVLWDVASRIYSTWLVAFLFNCRQAFSPSAKSVSMWCIHIVVRTRLLLWKNCFLFDRIDLTSIWSTAYR